MFQTHVDLTEPGSSSLSVPVCSVLPAIDPSQPCRCSQRPTNKASEAAEGAQCLQPPPQSRGLGEASPEPHPSLELARHQVREDLNGCLTACCLPLPSSFSCCGSSQSYCSLEPTRKSQPNIQEKVPEETTYTANQQHI